MGTAYKIMSAKSNVWRQPKINVPHFDKENRGNSMSSKTLQTPVLEIENINPENVAEVTGKEILAIVNQFEPNHTRPRCDFEHKTIAAKEDVSLFIETREFNTG